MYTAFQHCSGDSRHLTSFPTRRSSDLEHNRDRGRQIELARCGRIHAPILREPVVAHQQLCVVVLEKVQSAVTTTTPGFAAKDRKSTRLNSSHVEISYAVFCLKKKTRSPIARPTSSLLARRYSSFDTRPEPMKRETLLEAASLTTAKRLFITKRAALLMPCCCVPSKRRKTRRKFRFCRTSDNNTIAWKQATDWVESQRIPRPVFTGRRGRSCMSNS